MTRGPEELRRVVFLKPVDQLEQMPEVTWPDFKLKHKVWKSPKFVRQEQAGHFIDYLSYVGLYSEISSRGLVEGTLYDSNIDYTIFWRLFITDEGKGYDEDWWYYFSPAPTLVRQVRCLVPDDLRRQLDGSPVVYSKNP